MNSNTEVLVHRIVLATSLLLASDVALAQFRPLRFDDDFSAQRDLGACWKDCPIAEQVRLSIGGDLRLRYEHAGNPRYGLERQDRWGVLMQRASVFADLRLGEHWRGFAQLASSFTNGRAAGPSPVDENRLDPSNLFVEWRSARDGDGSMGVRVGIQELQFGSGRSIDAREGPNVRRSFDAVRLYLTQGAWRVDAFAAAPRQNRPGSVDDARSQTQRLQGIYATRSGDITSLDVYALYYDDTVGRYAQGSAHERRWSLGTRVFGNRKAWDWNWEFAVQGGHFGDAGIRAWSLATETGYTFDHVPGQPRAALLLAIASGDKDPEDHRLGTLNPLYPRGNYFGDEATLGPRNFANIHPAMSMQLAPRVQLNASLDFFWRHSTRDGVYAPNGTLIRAAGNSRARYVATIASLGTTWTLTPGWSSTAVIAYGQPGAFLRETGANDALSFVSLSAQYRF
ncbi:MULTISPECIES: alginate export family protein [unclassified Duganella]|uniref:alginate export family protein n=1 Tax=unclassified Duganella TaxID=2636909 RepID=UPI0008925114|nr:MULTISPECIES: alginate export family protein [unclassified Duganella]SDH15829.1 Alginate export [Duganella sp. OV458]SDK30368.1 Alginate export [Duganella sp. OV510]